MNRNTNDKEFNAVRKLPFSYEAEQSVLGSILLDPERFPDVAMTLESNDFYLDEHAQIYTAIQELFLKSRTIDVVTLIDMLVKQGLYPTDEQSKNYITSIADMVPSAANVKDYMKIVKDKSLLRQIIHVCDEITESAYTAQDEVADILDVAAQKVFNVAQGNEVRNFTPVRDIIVNVYEHLQLIRSGSGEAVGTPSGFSDLDRVLAGFNNSDLILIGARPGMGKTAFAMNIATHAARRTKKSVCVFQLEMSKEQLVQRMLSSEGLVDSHNIRTGILSDRDWDNLAQAASSISELPVLIDDSTGITVTGMKAKLRRVKNLGMVVIDYLQLMQSDRKIDNRVNEISEISRNLKLMAKELRVPVITCAQLNRGPESRTDKTPLLSDLRDSGAIEQDADVVMFLYRPEYYKSDEPQNVAEVIIAKNRHGSTGKIEMGWFGQYTKFTDLKRE
ncbi:MAG: replicative DNA helicase [Oscillospiraceae bacterium]|nr:replicative DNA helicase [Oscillospiraceae bacterium]